MANNILYHASLNDADGNPYTIQIVGLPAAEVELVTCTQKVAATLSMITDTYNGRLDTKIRGMRHITKNLKDIANTKLQTPLEMIHMVWLFTDVTRAFTHQLVRYRVGTSFCQESMRFYGKHRIYKVLATHQAGRTGLVTYRQGAIEAIKRYVEMVDRGIPSEDARGVLPTNILTSIFFDCSLRTLQGIFPQRLCCQAQQGEWQPILREMRDIVNYRMGSEIADLLQAPYERGEPCGYRASFDRPCKWQEEN